MTDRVVALVPIKLNNERLPGKNTMIMADGLPMMSHLLITLSRARGLDETFVYCSDESIAGLVEDLGARFLKRSPDLDTSSTRSNDILLAFTNEVPADIYVLAHATSPFVKAETVSAGVSAIRSGDFDSAFTALEVRNFFWADGAPANYDPRSIPRTQDLDPIYLETSAYFAFRRELFIESGRRIGDHPKIVVVDEIEAADVDRPIDFAIANALVAQGLVEDWPPRHGGAPIEGPSSSQFARPPHTPTD